MKTLLTVQTAPDSLRGRRRSAAGLFLIGLIACLAIGVTVASAQNYAVSDLGDLPNMKASAPAAINNSSQVVGISSAGADEHAFGYHKDYDKTMKEIGSCGSRAFAINASGLVAGDYAFVSPYGPERPSHATLFKGRPVADLGVLKGGLFSRANGINNWEQVVGFSGPDRDAENSRAFVWTAATGMVDIGTLGGAYAQAYGINDAGFITGTAQTADGWIGATHAFLYQIVIGDGFSRPMIDLGTLGGNSSHGLAINAQNHVVGYSTINTTDSRVHAFFYGDGRMVDLGSLSGKHVKADKSAALAINSTDQVVGYSYLPSNEGPIQVGFIYNMSAAGARTGMQDLNGLIGSAAKQYRILAATGINDLGEIVATAVDGAGTVHAVLLTPSFGEVRQ